MALLATDLAAAGVPVLRYDRRGIGDSTGENRGFRSAEADLRAAATAFRAAAPEVTRLVAFGNCDAATTLALFGRGAGIDRVLLANPWIVEDTDDLPPRAAIRARYAARLQDPLHLLRAFDVVKFVKGLRKLLAKPGEQVLAQDTIAAIAGWGPEAFIVLAARDATALAFDAAAGGRIAATDIDTNSHSFARPADKAALRAWIEDALS